MLSAADIHAFLRDEHAWKRAVHQLLDDAYAPATIGDYNGNWLVFRSGSSENAFSLRFANSLRHPVFTDSVDTTFLSHTDSTRLRQRWNSSARCDADGPHTDLLQQLLARNLRRKGAAAMLKIRKAPQLARPSCISPVAREARRRRELSRSAQELIDLERYERQRLVTQERKCFTATASVFFEGAVKHLLSCELSERRAVFRQWQEGKRCLAASMGSELWRLTGMTPQQFKELCRLLLSEAVTRRRIQVMEGEDRELYARFMHIAQLKTLGKESNECRLRVAQPPRPSS
ncbi:hypothetical protein LSCM1_06347 [Leishmania martiniquensis]|uniref:Uncharacterized protein n=1 Tax=Leishmania martiniquensis TaxID=1580590 RepID=A0A836KLG3_9TRYP|nr:hypothetical protein LSCM1_06347 [Leishmania martiniquensis]